MTASGDPVGDDEPQRGSKGHLDLCCASPLPNGRVHERILCGADRGGRAAMAKRGQALGKARAARKPAKPPVDLKHRIAELERELAQAQEQNVRLFDEVLARTDELSESLQQ